MSSDVVEALRRLIRLWESQQRQYPDTNEGRAAAAAVRLCANELKRLADDRESKEGK